MAKDQYLAGKLALVTGASKANGIGAAVAYLLAEHGADVAITYNKNATAAEETTSRIRKLGAKAVAIQANQSSESYGEALINLVLKTFDTTTIDIIVNNAGTSIPSAGIEQTPISDFDAHFLTNVRGPWLLIQAAIPHLPSPGGRIVNVGSILSKNGSMYLQLYSGSKAALATLSLAWAEELGPKGITVNTVSPGPIGTDLAAEEGHPLMQKFRWEQYIKRSGETEEVAAAIGFLASPQASFITGQNLMVDGGLIYQ
ncbi:NAD(P)-binding protein [Eremomyces bilateralis CBS 781.70]|uniref:NAD(P)-binding protein n=1 Tax=Eremomyces bilateralis CBS 781.70 TaxID=1392243 RepID=A0A6G1G9W6_9PEZI|nr:NAD(P)-binding protein [Eremomyces bilateralis CBS 781.70]KAF1814691.1 NAD(P)-binding protein [Eremomyces bilateralis CBS 781.70]